MNKIGGEPSKFPYRRRGNERTPSGPTYIGWGRRWGRMQTPTCRPRGSSGRL